MYTDLCSFIFHSQVYIIKAMSEEESSEASEKEATENTEAVTTSPESIRQVKKEKAGSKKQAQKTGSRKQPVRGTKRKHNC